MRRDMTPAWGSDKLAKLLQLGAAEEGPPERSTQPDSEDQKVETLQRLLQTALPLKEVLARALPMVIQRVCQELDALSTGAMEKALLDPDAPQSVIEQIKAHAKQITKTTTSADEKEAATVLYYAAIASALVFHNQRITKIRYANLKRSLDTLAAKTWVSKEITGLLEDAANVCAKQGASEA